MVKWCFSGDFALLILDEFSVALEQQLTVSMYKSVQRRSVYMFHAALKPLEHI